MTDDILPSRGRYATAQNAAPLYVLAKRYDVDGNQMKRLWWATQYPGM